MTNPARNILLLFFILQFIECDTEQNKTIKKPLQDAPKNIFGLYSYFVTGSTCESIKYALRLNEDSSFVMKIYCYADSTSPFRPTIKAGKWSKETDSTFKFVCSDATIFKLELLNDTTIQIIPKKVEETLNYPFTKDTTKDEMFWQH